MSQITAECDGSSLLTCSKQGLLDLSSKSYFVPGYDSGDLLDLRGGQRYITRLQILLQILQSLGPYKAYML